MTDFEKWFKEYHSITKVLHTSLEWDDTYHTSVNFEEVYQAFKARLVSELGLDKKPRKASVSKPDWELSPELKPLFDSFWDAGMRKVGDKNKAKGAFCRVLAISEFPRRHVEMMIQDIKKRIESNQFGFDSMHPTTYLNGARWKDEIIDKSEQIPKDIKELEALHISKGGDGARPGETEWDYRNRVTDAMKES